MAASLESWAVPRLQQLLPLDEDSLKQVVAYADTLPKDAAARHFGDLLGDGPKALEFVTAFNQRRGKAPDEAASKNATPRTASPASGSEVPRQQARKKKPKANIHALPPRQVEGHGNVGGGYRKRAEAEEYNRPRPSHKQQVADNLALREKPDATQMPLITDTTAPTTAPAPRPPPSAAGQLISDALAPAPKKGSNASSRTNSPAPKTKVTISGGTAMHGASTALTDLDSAIRSLEIQTNPSLASDSPADRKARNCNCMATRHPLLTIAPNCLSCGKVICLKQGLGPCTSCNTPLLSADDIATTLRVLKDERGEARMRANNASQKKADVASGKPRAFTGREFLSSSQSKPTQPSPLEAEAKDQATAHRDKLLAFQASNARRTRVHDEAADYDIPASGTNPWASPAERAAQLKRQQRALREMEWAAAPAYEKRQMVASIDLKGGKIVRKMAGVEKPDFEEEHGEGSADEAEPAEPGVGGGEGKDGGAFARNPLVGTMVRPRAREDRKGKGAEREKASTWRRVQMDEDDNEGWILDGGTYGGRIEGRVLGDEEHAFGS